MCMFRITTYEKCWAQYTHILICTVESYNNDEHASPGDRVLSALKCPNLKSEHFNVENSNCNCKTHPQEFRIICNRKWGGDFVGDVDCPMLPGSAVRFEFRGREWNNCTNVEMLLRGGKRLVPEDYNPAARDWNDSEWDGDSKMVNWRDKDWVTLAEKGMSAWQRHYQGRGIHGQDTMVQQRSRFAERGPTYENVQLEKNEMLSAENNLTRPKGQRPLPQFTAVTRQTGSINDAVVKWRSAKDEREAAAKDQYMSPSPPSVGQPRHQRKASLSGIHPARQARHFVEPTERKPQHTMSSTFAVDASPTGQRVVPFFDRARQKEIKENDIGRSGATSAANVPHSLSVPLGLKEVLVKKPAKVFIETGERERERLAASQDNYLQSSTHPDSTVAAQFSDDEYSPQYSNPVASREMGANIGTGVSAPWEPSSVPIYATESSQARRQREQDEKRNNFLQNTYRQRVAAREKRLHDQTEEANQFAQDGTQDINMDLSAQQDDSVPTNIPLPTPWNGVPEFVLSHDYNNTLPESDDSNFNFNNYSPNEMPTGEIQEAALRQTLGSAPKIPFKAPRQSSSSGPASKDPLLAMHENSTTGPSGSMISSKPHRADSIQERRLRLEPNTSQDSNRSEMSSFSEPEEQLKYQSVKPKETAQDVLQAQSQQGAFSKQSSHFQERPERRAMRKLQEIEEQSKIQGNRNERDFLHDPNELVSFLQDFTRSEGEIAERMWMAAKSKVDEQYNRYHSTKSIGSGETSSSQANDRMVGYIGEINTSGNISHSDEDIDDEDDSGSESDEVDFIRLPAAARKRPSRLPRFLKSQRQNEVMINILDDQNKLKEFLSKLSTEKQNAARLCWSRERQGAESRAESLMKQINRCIDKGEEYEVKHEGNQRAAHRKVENKLQARLYRELSSLIKNGELSNNKGTRRRNERRARQNKMSNYGTALEEQVIGIGDYKSKHTGSAEVPDDQTTTLSDDEAVIEAQQKRKRDVQYSDMFPNIDVKKRKVDEERLEVESPESRKNRMRDLYYAGLASSMGSEQSEGAEIQVENDEDQEKRQDDPQPPALPTIHDEGLDNDEVQADNSRSQLWIDFDYEALGKGKRHREQMRILEMPRFSQPVFIPKSFHDSYQSQFPRQPNEKRAAFKDRKYAAYINSEEYQQQKSASANAMGSHNQNEANSGRQRHPASTRQSQRLMDREAEAQEQVTSINDAAKAIGVENQMMSRTGDDELADYNSDQDIGMKTEYGSRSQSIGLSGIQQRPQSFIANLPAAVQNQDIAMEGNIPHTAVDLTTGNERETAIDLTSD